MIAIQPTTMPQLIIILDIHKLGFSLVMTRLLGTSNICNKPRGEDRFIWMNKASGLTM